MCTELFFFLFSPGRKQMVSISCNTYKKWNIYLVLNIGLAQPCILVMTNNIDEDVVRRGIRA